MPSILGRERKMVNARIPCTPVVTRALSPPRLGPHRLVGREGKALGGIRQHAGAARFLFVRGFLSAYSVHRSGQGHHKAVDPPGEAKPDGETVDLVFRRVRGLVQDSADPKDEILKKSFWTYTSAEDVMPSRRAAFWKR